MRILAVSDLHGSKGKSLALVAAAAEADVVIAAGDFCDRREGLDDALALLAGVRVPVIAVPGNAESAEELSAAAPETWTVLHGDAAEVARLRVFGLGYAVPETPFGAWSCDLREAEAEALLAQCDAPDILVTHSPPKGVADSTGTGLSVGSTAIRAAIERCQPPLAVCGHVHDSWGQGGLIGATHVLNLGPDPVWLEDPR